jgi:5'-nucleotidase
VLIAQAGDFGRYLGRVDLEIDDQTGKVIAACASLLPLTEEPAPDSAVQAAWLEQQAQVRSRLAEPVGTTTAAIDFDPIGESPLANLLADVLRQRSGADVALIQPTHLLAGLPAGDVTLGDVYAACKSPGNPGLRSLSGARLLEMLEIGLDPERAARTAAWGRGRPNGRLAVSGMRGCFDPAAPAGQLLTQVMIGDQPLEPGRSYQVASSDAELSETSWLDADRRCLLSFEFDEDGIRYEVPTTLRDVLEDHLRRSSPLSPPGLQRFTTIQAGNDIRRA